MCVLVADECSAHQNYAATLKPYWHFSLENLQTNTIAAMFTDFPPVKLVIFGFSRSTNGT